MPRPKNRSVSAPRQPERDNHRLLSSSSRAFLAPTHPFYTHPVFSSSPRKSPVPPLPPPPRRRADFCQLRPLLLLLFLFFLYRLLSVTNDADVVSLLGQKIFQISRKIFSSIVQYSKENSMVVEGELLYRANLINLLINFGRELFYILLRFCQDLSLN